VGAVHPHLPPTELGSVPHRKLSKVYIYTWYAIVDCFRWQNMWWKPHRWKHGNQFKNTFWFSENFEIWYIHSAYKYVLTCKSWDANQFKHDCFTLTVMNFNLQNIAKLLVCRVNAYAPAVDSICLYIWNR